jgi:hypothetical protein
MSDPNFFSHLSPVSQVASLVGDRIYPTRAPQGVLRPYIVWLRQGATRQQLYCGADDVVLGEYQFSCYGTTALEADDVHEAVRNAMQDFSGLMGGTFVKHCHLEQDFAIEDEDPNLFTVRQLWRIWFIEE